MFVSLQLRCLPIFFFVYGVVELRHRRPRIRRAKRNGSLCVRVWGGGDVITLPLFPVRVSPFRQGTRTLCRPTDRAYVVVVERIDGGHLLLFYVGGGRAWEATRGGPMIFVWRGEGRKPCNPPPSTRASKGERHHHCCYKPRKEHRRAKN